MYRLMIVEDEKLIRQGLVCHHPWESWGFVCAGEAENGLQALDAFARIRPDAVFTDLRMPDMDGLELIRRLRKRHIDCPVVIISGYADFAYAQEAMRYNAMEYLLKPIKERALEETAKRVKQCLDERAALRGPAISNLALEPVLAYIDTHYACDLRLEQLAALIHLSISQLGRLFRAELGISVGEYIKQRRVNAAKTLLSKTELRVNEVAIHVGMDDVSYFSRVFKDQTGRSPREYRDHAKES